MSQSGPAVFKVAVGEGDAVTVKVDLPARHRADAPLLILAHGANNNLDHPLLAALASYLPAQADTAVVRFNFPYAERKASTVDPAPILENAFRCVHDHIRNEVAGPQAPLFLGGKSLGGRLAAELVSRGDEGGGLLAVGLVVLGYPLHRPGQKDRPNLEPLRRIGIPSLFCVGSRDPLCDPELLSPVLARLQYPGRLYVVRGGDHSLERQDAPGDFSAAAEEVARFIRETIS